MSERGPIVLDASLALAWCFKDEADARSEAVKDRVKIFGAVVPTLWHLEVANILTLAERRGRLSPTQLAARIEGLAELPITVDEETPARAFHDIAALARAEKLTTYDAAYLELAMRLGAPLATRDAELVLAARRVGVEVFG